MFLRILYLLNALLLSGCIEKNTQPTSLSLIEISSPLTLKERVLRHLERQKSASCDYSNRVNNAPPPMRIVDLSNRNKVPFRNSEGYAAFIHAFATEYYFGGRENSDKAAIDLIYQWAKGSAHEIARTKDESLSSARYTTYMVIGSTLNALFLLDKSPYLSDEKRYVIWEWLDALVEKSYITKELPYGRAGYLDFEQRVNNHNSRRATILAYYAAHKNSLNLLELSNHWIERSFGTINEGIIYDANRGDWALNYINLAIAAIVEHTAFLSILVSDPNAQRKRKLINEVAEFLFRETLNPVEIHRYAKENIGRPNRTYSGEQLVWWTERYTNGLTHYAWIDAGLLDKDPPLRLDRPRYSEIGGFINCWY